MEPAFIAVDMLVRIFITCILSSLIATIFKYVSNRWKGMMRMGIDFYTDIVADFTQKIIETALLA